MADINVEKLKEKLYPAAKALFMIGETLVDASKQHISAEDAIDKIRSYMYDTDVIGSRLRVDILIGECMESVVSRVLDDKQTEWIREYIGKWNIEAPDIVFPSCCDGCSNNPKNGGSGICNCTLPYMQNPTIYTANTSIDDFCMTATTSTGAYIFGNEQINVDNQTKADANRIADAVERTKKYIKED